jgi:G3E family GTPase
LVSRAQIDRIKSWLDEHFHRYRLIEATRFDVPLDVLLAGGRFDAARLEAAAIDDDAHDHGAHDCDYPHCHRHHGADHSRTFSACCYESDEPLSLDALREVASGSRPRSTAARASSTAPMHEDAASCCRRSASAWI